MFFSFDSAMLSIFCWQLAIEFAKQHSWTKTREFMKELLSKILIIKENFTKK